MCEGNCSGEGTCSLDSSSTLEVAKDSGSLLTGLALTVIASAELSGWEDEWNEVLDLAKEKLLKVLKEI